MHIAGNTYLKFGSVWHHLSFDIPVVHSRLKSSEPGPWAVEEEWNYPIINVGVAGDLIGVRLKSYQIVATERGATTYLNLEVAAKCSSAT